MINFKFLFPPIVAGLVFLLLIFVFVFKYPPQVKKEKVNDEVLEIQFDGCSYIKIMDSHSFIHKANCGNNIHRHIDFTSGINSKYL